MTAFAEGVKRKLNNLSKGSKSNVRLCETVHVRSRIETIASTIKKGSNLQQNPKRFCFKCYTLAFFEMTVSQIGPNSFELMCTVSNIGPRKGWRILSGL